MAIKISILVPAYEFPLGIDKILSALSGSISEDIEIIISDDSAGCEVETVVEGYARQFGARLKYIRNQPALGAVNNWNALLDKANGEFVLLLHHDEYPLGASFASRVLNLIKNNSDIDVHVLGCMLVSHAGCTIRPHVPSILRSAVLKFFPSYLMKRNVIGPSSCLIVRRALYTKYDNNLKWLVDVDNYYRLRMLSPKWRVDRTIQIGSTLGRDDSITASIKSELKELNQKEREYVSNKFGAKRIWLEPYANHRVLNHAEDVAWKFMRVITIGYYKIAVLIKRLFNSFTTANRVIDNANK